MRGSYLCSLSPVNDSKLIYQSTSEKCPNTVNNDVKCDSKLEDQSIFLGAFMLPKVMIGEVKFVCVEN